MSIVDALNQIWGTILEIMSIFVIPDWGALIALLPVFIFLGVVAPFVTFTLLGILGYQIARPRAKVRFVEGLRVALTGADGEPIFPSGLPFCRRDGLIYPSNASRCDTCGDELAVTCPMCSLGRSAAVDTCSNCGLVLKVKPRAVAVRTTSGPRPGGAAAA
ncbi:MAG: hypothetical protein ABIQ58_02985 [Candidatus Limnocylindrales bacterium]